MKCLLVGGPRHGDIVEAMKRYARKFISVPVLGTGDIPLTCDTVIYVPREFALGSDPQDRFWVFVTEGQDETQIPKLLEMITLRRLKEELED